MKWNKVSRLKLQDIDAHAEQSIVHYDWLNAVIPIDSTDYPSIEDCVQHMLVDLGFDNDLQPVPNKKGLFTYDKSSSLFEGSVIVAYPTDLSHVTMGSTNNSSTIVIQASGRGLESMGAMLENYGRSIDYYFENVRNKRGWFSRMDIALDLFNFSDEYSPYNAYELSANGQLVTHSRTVRWMHEFPSTGMMQSNGRYSTDKEGTTFYIGKNPNQLRIYNKKAERKSKVGLLFNVDSWYRWEFELNGDRSKDFMIDVERYGLVDAYRAWLRHHRFTKLDDSNRSRRSNLPWYDRLVNELDYTCTSLAVKPTFKAAERWFGNQVAPTFATLFMVRRNKYIQNGLSDEDAEALAWKTIKRDYIDAAISDERVDLSRLEAFEAEHIRKIQSEDDE